MKLRLAKFLTGLLLLPLCVALSMTFWRAVVILAQSPTRLPMLHAFACVAGIAIWAIIWLFLPPLTRTYVLGHELTHALVDRAVRRQGLGPEGVGARRQRARHAKTTPGSRCPPISSPSTPSWWRCSGCCPSGSSRRSSPTSPIFLFWIGLTWSFHFTFTLRFLAYNQPDIREHGRLFSYTLIYALNLLSIGAALVAVSTWSFPEAFGDLLDNFQVLAAAVHTFYEWALTRLPDFS